MQFVVAAPICSFSFETCRERFAVVMHLLLLFLHPTAISSTPDPC